MTTTEPTTWPPTLQAALDRPPLDRRGWQTGLAPQAIGLFLWVAFFDQIPREAVGRCGLLWPVAGAAVGGLLCYLLLFRAPALWGQRTGRPIAVLAARTFGVDGATWVPGLLLTLVQVVWLAVATLYGTALGLAGLQLTGFLDPGVQRPPHMAVVELRGTLFLVISLFWGLAAALTGRYLVRVIAALMSVYPLFPALLLGLTAAVALKGLPDYQASVDQRGGSTGGVFAALVVVQMIFGFFSAAALLFADWGSVAREERDVRYGGWVGVAMAPWVIATLAILSVAGAFARYGLDTPAGVPRALSFEQSVRILVAGKTAGVMLIGFGLAALAPACYAAFLFGERLNLLRPHVARTKWTVAGAVLAWLLVASGLVSHLLPVFGFVGAVFAPVAGAISADYVRSRGAWTHPRRGWNRPGFLAWAVGLVVGLTPVVAGVLGYARLAAAQPAAVYAYLAAFVTYLAVAPLGESPDEPAIGPAPPAVDA